MSSKETFIVHLRKARTHHLKWLNQIKLLVSGIGMDKEAISINQSESLFGVWLYDEAVIFSSTVSKNVLQEIETLHTECFEHYLKIYHMLFNQKSGGLFGSLMGPKKPGASELMLARQFYEELVKASDALIGRLRVFESQLLATSEAKFEELVLNEDEPEGQIDLVGRPKTLGNVQRIYRGQPVD